MDKYSPMSRPAKKKKKLAGGLQREVVAKKAALSKGKKNQKGGHRPTRTKRSSKR